MTVLTQGFELLPVQPQELFLSIPQQMANGRYIGDTNGVLDLNQLRHQDKGFHWVTSPAKPVDVDFECFGEGILDPGFAMDRVSTRRVAEYVI